ncbi:hypothetical protein CTAYLR_004094 [Chrysophaeum taylorii]|uniref:Prohibitin n=1 Tax=Chrysophaeum taylorii TaxID=2483200 RepID=A0AAD7XLJ1_9STRA|nr:hypothetical protein CTAYLR_004094 [Chrysophaeum taylorii]
MMGVEKYDGSRPPPTGKYVVLGGLIFLVGFVCAFRVVPPAHAGVVTTFGSVAPETLSSGLHIVYPWSQIINFKLKTQLLDSENVVPTQEGLNVELDVAVLFHLDPKGVRDLYLTLGEDYVEVLVRPELASAVRGLTSEQSAKALYTSGRRVIQTHLFDELQTKFSKRGLLLEDVLLKAIKLPSLLTDAIELKAQAEQDAARMEFVLTKEEQEAKRKTVEADGIAKFQHIVSEGISPQLLQWKGIEATEKLAESKNAKLVIVGNSDNNLPVLLSAPTGGGGGGAAFDS